MEKLLEYLEDRMRSVNEEIEETVAAYSEKEKLIPEEERGYPYAHYKGHLKFIDEIRRMIADGQDLSSIKNHITISILKNEAIIRLEDAKDEKAVFDYHYHLSDGILCQGRELQDFLEVSGL